MPMPTTLYPQRRLSEEEARRLLRPAARPRPRRPFNELLPLGVPPRRIGDNQPPEDEEQAARQMAEGDIMGRIWGLDAWAPTGGGTGTFPEAPADGRLYGRNGQLTTWQPTIPEAPIDGRIYARRGQDETWQLAAAQSVILDAQQLTFTGTEVALDGYNFDVPAAGLPAQSARFVPGWSVGAFFLTNVTAGPVPTMGGGSWWFMIEDPWNSGNFVQCGGGALGTGLATANAIQRVTGTGVGLSRLFSFNLGEGIRYRLQLSSGAAGTAGAEVTFGINLQIIPS
jgi:hypothetical protein